MMPTPRTSMGRDNRSRRTVRRVRLSTQKHILSLSRYMAFISGTLDLLVLKTLTWGPRHGYAIARWLEDTTNDALQIEEGSLYPALYRLERRGLIEASWGTSEIGKRIKIYSLTKTGRAQLKAESAEWSQFSAAVAKVMGV